MKKSRSKKRILVFCIYSIGIVFTLSIIGFAKPELIHSTLSSNWLERGKEPSSYAWGQIALLDSFACSGKGVSVVLGLSRDIGHGRGVHIAGCGNYVKSFNGILFAGLANRVDRTLNGGAISLVGGGANTLNGFLVSGLFHVSSEANGLSAASINLCATKMNGVQLGVACFAMNATGVEAGLLCVSDHCKGIQFGFGNLMKELVGGVVGVFSFSDSIRGVQLGMLNATQRLNGIQIGLFNSARDVSGLQLGLICHNASGGWHSWFPFVNW